MEKICVAAHGRVDDDGFESSCEALVMEYAEAMSSSGVSS